MEFDIWNLFFGVSIELNLAILLELMGVSFGFGMCLKLYRELVEVEKEGNNE